MKDLFIDSLEQNKEAIFRVCKAYADSQEDAKDLFQEVLISIWRALPSFQSRSSISTWIYRVTINVCLRAKQKNDRRRKLFLSAEALKLENVSFPVESSGQYSELYSCIKKLNDTDRSVVLLYLEDMSYKEIAAITGLSENHVAVKIMRIRKKLFQCLKP